MFSASTVTTVLQFSTILALVLLGQCLVILAGGAGIDLSVGGTMSLSVVLAMLAVKAGLPPSSLPLACICAGLLLGLFSWSAGYTAEDPAADRDTRHAFIGSFRSCAGVDRGAAQSGACWLAAVRVAVRCFPRRCPSWTLGRAGPSPPLRPCCCFVAPGGGRLFAMGFNERSARLVGIPGSIAPRLLAHVA